MPLRRITVQLSEESHAGWVRFCDAHHLNLSALLEALGLAFGQHADEPLEPAVEEIIQEALAIERERRKRPRSKP